MNSIGVLGEILKRNPAIQHLNVVEIGKQYLLQERLPGNSSFDDLFILALKKRKEYRIPFWDSLFTSLFDSENANMPNIIKEASFHNTHLIRTKVPLENILSNNH
jgi:hypothetical protein